MRGRIIFHGTGDGSGWTEYCYDEIGEQTEKRRYNEDGTLYYNSKYEYEYNELNKPVLEYKILPNGEKSLYIEYTYDSNGNLVELNFIDSHIIKYEYNSDNKRTGTFFYDHVGELWGWEEWEWEYSVH